MRWFLPFLISILITPIISSPPRDAEKCSPKNITRNARQVTQDEDYVPILHIPGTNMYTGKYYKIGMQRFPTGWVTWTEGRSPLRTGNLVQIDIFPQNTAHYEKSGKWYNDTQWFFVPSENEEGWYNLRNRQLPEALATWSQVEFPNIVLSKHADPDDSDSLWKPVTPPHLTKGTTNNNGQLFQLRLKSAPEGVVTWTDIQYLNVSHFIALDTESKTIANYKPNGEWYRDTLFTFEALDRELVGVITQLEMQLFPHMEQVKRLTFTDCTDGVYKTMITNLDSTSLVRHVKQDVVNHGELDLTLHGPISEFPFMKIRSSPFAQVSPPWYTDSMELYLVKDEYYSNDKISLKTIEHSKISKDVIISPWTTSEVVICNQYIDLSGTDVEIGVSVFLEISEKSYRPKILKEKIEAVYTKLPAEVTFTSVQNISKLYKKGNAELGIHNHVHDFDLEETELKILGLRETDVVAVVQGSVKNGKFGYHGVVTFN